jgi:hypothetical protein
MRRRPGIFLLSLCALAPLPAAARNLPPGCGPDKLKFNVTVGTIVADMPALAPGKARLIFIETLVKHGVLGAAPTTRYAVDGAWAGATKGNSFFLVDVDPGYHQICANWQAVNTTGDNVGMTQVNAIAGDTYYFQTAILEVAENAGPPGSSQIWTNIQFHFNPVSPQAGQDRLLYSGLSTFTTK